MARRVSALVLFWIVSSLAWLDNMSTRAVNNNEFSGQMEWKEIAGYLVLMLPTPTIDSRDVLHAIFTVHRFWFWWR